MLNKKDYRKFYSQLNKTLEKRLPSYICVDEYHSPDLLFGNKVLLDINLSDKVEYEGDYLYQLWIDILDNPEEEKHYHFDVIHTSWLNFNQIIDLVIRLYKELDRAPREKIGEILKKYSKFYLRKRTNDPHKSEELNDFVVEWIRENIIPVKTPRYNLWSSYWLKHRFSEDYRKKFPHSKEYGDFYIDNGQFKYAMLEAGIKPTEDNGVNAFYALSKKSPVFDRHK